MTDNKITKVSKTCRENNLEIATNERDKDYKKDIYLHEKDEKLLMN